MHRLITLFAIFLLCGCANSDWRTASREPAGIASQPNEDNRAIIEVYAADAFSWRGWFAVHPWVAIKEENAGQYTVYEVLGWKVKNGFSAIREYNTETPDRYWFGSRPELILSIKGDRAVELIPKIKQAVQTYPWPDEYTVFPGPNSNTFVAWIGKKVPELALDLPFSAIGSGYVDNSD